jgi:hypothetical protein
MAVVAIALTLALPFAPVHRVLRSRVERGGLPQHVFQGVRTQPANRRVAQPRP